MQDSFNTLPEPTSSISMREFGDMLRRRRAIILQTFVIVLVAGVLVTLFTAPIYHSSCRLLLEAPSYVINQVNSDDPLGDLMRVGSEYSMATQIELLQTGKIRKEVQDKIGSTNMPSLTIVPVENTQIIQIDSEGDNPDTVASAPNALMELYVDESYGESAKQITDALDFATKNQDQSQADLDSAETALRKFQDEHKIQEFKLNRDAQIKLVDELSGNYDSVIDQLRVLQARMRATREQMADIGRTKDPLISQYEDTALNTIDDRIKDVDLQYEILTNQANGDTPDNPAAQRLRLEDSKLRDRLADLKKTAPIRNTHINPLWDTFNANMSTMQIDASELTVKANLIQQQLAGAQARLKGFPSWESEFDKLQRKEESEKQLVDLFASKHFVLALRDKTRKKNASIMETASVPSSPIRPKKGQQIFLSGLLGLFLGLCLALLQELFDDRINNPEEAERVLRVPTLGHIPMIEEEGLRLIRDISTFSPLMEAYRSLRTNINFAAVGAPLHSVVITSSVPAEGKSTTVANLAMAMALDNKQVIVVDADLRRPSMHKLFKKDSSPGLTDILVGTHTMEQVIRDTNVPGVRVIPAGSPPPNPAELLGSPQMGHLLAQLEEACDIVLFDSPPTLAVADAVVLASRVDGALLIVGYGETKKTSSKKAIEILGRANANLLGIVLNRIEGPSSGYYYGKYYVPATDRNVVERDDRTKRAQTTPKIAPPEELPSPSDLPTNDKETDDL